MRERKRAQVCLLLDFASFFADAPDEINSIMVARTRTAGLENLMINRVRRTLDRSVYPLHFLIITISSSDLRGGGGGARS